MAQPITGVIITLDEEANVADCVHSLQEVCDEVIVVDSGSRDRTLELAGEAGALVVEQPYLGDGPQKNVGPQHAKNDWILSIDADERLSRAAVQAVLAIDFETTPHDAYAFHRRNLIGSRWIQVGGWYPDPVVRLYDRRKTAWTDQKGHASVTTADLASLEADLIHHSYASVGELFSKADRFSTRSAKLLWEKGKRAHVYDPVLHGSVAFVRRYLVRGGILGGLDGLSVAIAAATHAYLKYAKLLEFERDPECRKRLDRGLWD